MSDDLVQRLRKVQYLTGGPLQIAQEAADRIEALEAALRGIAEHATPGGVIATTARRALEGSHE